MAVIKWLKNRNPRTYHRPQTETTKLHPKPRKKRNASDLPKKPRTLLAMWGWVPKFLHIKMQNFFLTSGSLFPSWIRGLNFISQSFFSTCFGFSLRTSSLHQNYAVNRNLLQVEMLYRFAERFAKNTRISLIFLDFLRIVQDIIRESSYYFKIPSFWIIEM